MVSDSRLRLIVWVASAALVILAVAGAGLAAGWRLGYRQGLDVAGLEAAATLRDEVEVASALRIGDSPKAALLLELRIDEHASRLLGTGDNPAVFGALTRIQHASPELALAAAQLYRGLVVSPDPHGAALASRLRNSSPRRSIETGTASTSTTPVSARCAIVAGRRPR